MILIRMAQSGQLRGRVSEQALIGLLDQADGQANQGTAKKGGIVVSLTSSFNFGLSRTYLIHSYSILFYYSHQFQRRKDLDDDDWDI